MEDAKNKKLQFKEDLRNEDERLMKY